jgi:hypothetical protein
MANPRKEFCMTDRVSTAGTEYLDQLPTLCQYNIVFPDREDVDYWISLNKERVKKIIDECNKQAEYFHV